MHQIVAFPLVLALSFPALAADKPDVEAHVKAMAPYLDEQILAVAHVDLSRVDANALTAQVVQLGKFPPRSATEFTKTVQDFVGGFRRAGGKDLYVFFSLADLPANPPFLIVPLEGKADAQALIKLLKGEATGRPAGAFASEVVEQLDHAVFAGAKQTRRRLAGLKPVARPDLAKALAAAGDTTAQVVILPSADTRRAVRESLPALPKELGGAPVTVLTEGVVWGALGVDLPPRTKVHLFIQSSNAQAAQRLRDGITGVWTRLGQEKGVRQALPNFFEGLTKHLTPTAQGDHLTLDVGEKELTAFLAPAVHNFQVASARMRSQNNLKQIGLAMLNFHDSERHFPPAAIYGKDGKPLLSWRVAILPYIEQDQLFKQFKLDEPWDSEHNKKLIARMPAVYQADPGLKAGHTTYLGVAGKAAMFPPDPKPLRIQDVTDGTSNTIWVVEVAADRAVPWTKPEDYNYDPEKPLAGLRGEGGGFNALFVDGSVRFISAMIDPKTLVALFTRNGGEVIGNIP